jgi:DNA polymerase-3 subunit epsilon
MINPYNLKNLPPWMWKLLKGMASGTPDTDLDKLSYVVLDTETTGFDYQKDRILCIGALRLNDRRIKVRDCLEIYIKQEHYNHTSTEVHGILSREERPCLQESEAMEIFLEYLGEDVIVAHHANFDMTMLNNALQRNGKAKITNFTLDTSTLYRKTIISSPVVPRKERYTLDELADKFDISKKDRHTALGDAYITAIAFLRILHSLKKKGITTLRQAIR